jgi:hypothetical protein
MSNQSNSANLAQLSLRELADAVGQLDLVDCEPHRRLILNRIAAQRTDVDSTTPTVVLLRLLGRLASSTHLLDGDVSPEPARFGDEAAFAS